MNQKGFTVIEILIVIFTMSALLVLGFINFRDFDKRMSLNSSASQVIAALQLANERTVSSSSNTVHGVHFTTTTYVLFASSTYSALDPNNQTYNLPEDVEISGISLGGGSDVVFERVTGRTDNDGTIVLRIVSEPSDTRTIEISSSGRAGLGSAVIPADTRLADGRHNHFQLGWSIQNATNLTLTFHNLPSADTVNTVTMASYFNPGKTEFDWEGTTVVNGQNQTIRVHTHALDAFDTTLCIHRDGRVTNKALDIEIDGKDIVSYTNLGVATAGVFGGTMTAQ